MSKIDLISNDWTDLVFDGRNQAYGAYQLRRNTSRRNIWAMVFVDGRIGESQLGLQARLMSYSLRRLASKQRWRHHSSSRRRKLR